LDIVFGLTDEYLTFLHMTVRAIFVYFLGILIIKSHKRFMQLRTVFSFFLYILLGSMLAGSIIGASPFFHTLAAVLLIMATNGLVTISVFFSPRIERFLKGNSSILVSDGQIQWNVMRKYFITKDELFEALHQAHIEDLHQVKKAIFENSGSITIIKKT